MTSEQEIQDYVTKHLALMASHASLRPGYAYRSPADYVVQRGTFFTPAPLPPNLPALHFVAKQCFFNAWTLARCAHGRFRYAEGFAAQGIGDGVHVAEHAWCVDADNRVVDVTWDARPPLRLGLAYCGCVFDVSDVRPGRPHLHNWQDGYPLLKIAA